MASREWISAEHRIFRLPNGAIYARPSIPGVGRKEFALGVKELGPISSELIKKLIRLKERRVAELTRQGKPKPAGLVRFEDLGVEVIKAKGSKAFKTRESADIHLGKHLIPWLNQRHPYLYEWDDRGETIWQEYIDSKRKDSPDMKFLNHRKHLRMVLLLAHDRGILKRRVKLYDPDPEIDVGRVLSDAELRSLYRSATPTMQDQIVLAATSGFRRGEILGLGWDRVDFKNREVILLAKNTKTRKPRHVPMNHFVYAVLKRRHAFNQTGSPWVFPSRENRNEPQRSNRTAWARAKRKAKVTCRFHDLRHTFVTNAVRSGMNPILISKYVGMSQEIMARVYCHLDTSDLRKLAQGVGGRMGMELTKEGDV